MKEKLADFVFFKVCWERRTDSQMVNCRLFSRRIALCSQSEHFTFWDNFSYVYSCADIKFLIRIFLIFRTKRQEENKRLTV
jgi:hypothetical protein